MISLVIASDHHGFDLKNNIIANFKDKFNIIDLGAKSSDRVDYPDYASKVCEAIFDKVVKFGILICETGVGMSIAANRKSYIRAALCFDTQMAKTARQHYNANVLVLGSKQANVEEVFAMIENFVNFQFEGGRHATRLDKIN